jgi:p-aminobenzoyl-glutamate transporter AbgT
VLPTANWYLMAALVPVFTIAGTLVTEKVLEPRLGPYDAAGGRPRIGGRRRSPTQPEQRRSWSPPGSSRCSPARRLRAAGGSRERRVLRDPDGRVLVQRIGPFLNSIVG